MSYARPAPVMISNGPAWYYLVPCKASGGMAGNSASILLPHAPEAPVGRLGHD